MSTARAVPVLEHQPALDGVRGLAVALVLGFHLEIGWLSGGYLGVSVFFTLSGFLITGILLREHERTGRVDLPGFYQRRARRLLPAGLVTLAAVCLLVAFDLVQPRTTFHRDLLSSMFQTLNWTQLMGQQSYADLFSAQSPVAHFWSLGIEEQFYVLWPITMVLLVRHTRRAAAPGRLVWLLGGLWVMASLSAPLTARLWSSDAAYYATWARAPEVLGGAVLAALLLRHRIPRWCAWLAPAALAIIAVAVVFTPAGRGWAFEGGLPVFGLVSTLLVAGLQVPGLTTRLLSWSPLVWAGRLSYGLYLYHWPTFIVLDSARTGLDGVSLIVVRLSVTTLAAIVSYVVIERPVRERRFLASARLLTGSMVTAVAVLAMLVLSVEAPAASRPDLIPTVVSAPATEPIVTAPPAADGGDDGAVESTAVPQVASSAIDPTAIVLFGDSVPAWLVRDAATSYDRPDVLVLNGAREACDGMVDMPAARDRFGKELLPESDCQEWDTWYGQVLDNFGIAADVVVLVLGQAPALDHLVDGSWVGPCDSIDWYLDDMQQRVDYLRDRNVPVVFALPATLGSRSRFAVPDDYEQRMTCIRAALTPWLSDLAVPVIDLNDVLCPEGDCEALRKGDGVHIDPASAPAVLDWIIDAVLSVA